MKMKLKQTAEELFEFYLLNSLHANLIGMEYVTYYL